jgi:hypothetical protein
VSLGKFTAALVVAACMLLPATDAVAKQSFAKTIAFGGNGGKGKKIKTLAGRIDTDGFLTPGTQETITFRRMPKHASLQAFVGFSFLSRTCALLCIPEQIEPAAGDAPLGLRTDSHGRLTVNFTMPTHFDRAVRRKHGKLHIISVPYKQGDIVMFGAFSFIFHKDRRLLAFADEQDVIDFPSAPAQP